MQRTALRGAGAVLIIAAGILIGYVAGIVIGDQRVISHRVLIDYIDGTGETCGDIVEHKDGSIVCEIDMKSPSENIKIIRVQ